jgi:ACS family hexuronate transporter-like MFS transporter
MDELQLPPVRATTFDIMGQAMRGSLRWRIALLIGAAIAISYFDRQTLPVAIAAIQREIPVTNSQFADLQAYFLIAYALMYAGGGKLIDTLGTRAGFAWIMLWWSLACASHGLARSFAMLAGSRLLLGAGEGGGFPAATKAVSEWFPARERSTAMGIINAGTAAGAVVAPPAISLIVTGLNWRWVFFLSGSIGLVWTAFWWARYRPAREHPRLSASERETIAEALRYTGGKERSAPWFRLLSIPQVWGLVSAKFLSDAAWYFYLFWLPKYLYDARGFDIKSVGAFAWIPYAFSGVGSLCGGWFSSELIRRGHSLNFARKAALGASAALMPWILFLTHVPVGWAIGLFSIAFFGQQSWSTLVMILPTDLFPHNAVGSVAGLVGFGGAIGGAVFGVIAGYLLDHGFGYGPVFLAVSTFHVIAFFVILLSVREVAPLHDTVLEATL